MPSLSQSIKADLITALKEKDQAKVSTLRMVQAAVKNREIEIKKREEGLNDEELIDVLRKEAKKRKDAIDAYTKGRRNDLVEKESRELEILQKYLPEQLSNEEIKTEVEKTIRNLGTVSVKDLGKVMGMVMQQLKGRAEGARVSAIVKEILSSN